MTEIEKEPSHTYTSVVESVFQVERSAWNSCANFIDDSRNIGNPFLSHEFFSCLEESGSVSKETGWISQHILLFEKGNSLIGILPNYLKNHSFCILTLPVDIMVVNRNSLRTTCFCAI